MFEKRHVFERDVLKSIFVIPRIFLELLGLWPGNKAKTWRNILFLIIVTVCFTEDIGHLLYFFHNRRNVKEIPATVISITTVFQGLSKITTLHLHRETLKKMHDMVHNDFWPSDLFGERVENDLKKMGKAASVVMIFVYTTAIVYFIGVFVVPLSNGDYKLPLNTYYGFDFGFSPVFEILYVIQCGTNMFVVTHGVRGHDDLFVALSTNCMGQFKLLKEAMRHAGTGNERTINSLLDKICLRSKNYKSEEVKLLVRCVEHHRKLLEFCDHMETAFTGSLCVQLFVSLAAICVSSFALIVVDLDVTEMPGLFSYCSGHITQLFIFCVLGEEITCATTSFGDSVYGCAWENQGLSELRKTLPLIISQANARPKKITALRVVTLNNSTFIKVMRLSFSYHTLLSQFFEKN